MRAPCWKQSTGYIPEDLQARHVKYVLNQKKKLFYLWLHSLTSSKYKGIAIFRVPAPKTEFEKSWKDKLVAVTKDREIDVPLRERIKSGRLFICQCHFTEDQILRHDTRVTLKPGLNLPVKSFPPSSSKPRVCWQHL